MEYLIYIENLHLLNKTGEMIFGLKKVGSNSIYEYTDNIAPKLCLI